jgi:hypothetical protein
MANLLTVQRRILLFVTAAIFTAFIRLISAGSSLRDGRSALVVSDRGQMKQVALRVTRVRGGILPVTLGIHDATASTSYLLRIANSSPFIKIDNLSLHGNASLQVTSTPPVVADCSDGDGDGDGDGLCDGSCTL